MLSRVAAYLSRLPEQEYGVPAPLASAVNYLLDSYWRKVDERAEIARRREKYVPQDLDVHLKELWLGCEIHTAVSLNRSYPSFARSLNAWAFTRLFKQWAGPSASYEIVPLMDSYEYKDNLKGSRAYRIQSEQMNISLDETVILPVFGTFFVRNVNTGAHLIVSIDLCYYEMSCSFTVLAHSHGQQHAEKFLFDLQLSMTENDIYQKKCLSFIRGHLDFYGIISTTWDEIVLKGGIKTEIRDNSIGILKNMDELASVGMCPNRNMLLISPPGMAKTTIFRATSNEIEGAATRIWCTGKSIRYPEDVTSMFEAARTLAPCIIFIEDMDLFGSERTSLQTDSAILNEFLAQLDGTQTNAGIVVMASTNDLVSMDEALTNRPGRFSVKIEIPYPDAEDRSAMLKSFMIALHARPDASVTKDTWKTVIDLCAGFTGDYVKEIARAVVIRATRQGRNQSGQVIFTADDLTTAGEQAIRNFAIGKKARRHHDLALEGEVGVTER